MSVVIPAYNEEHRLPPTLRRIIGYLDDRNEPFEVIVVDDGSQDHTSEVAQAGVSQLGDRGRVLTRSRNWGKGASVQRGMLAARGERVLFSDADLSTPIEEIEKLDAELTAGAKVVIGSRAMDRATVEKRQGRTREAMGRLFNLFVQVVAVGGVWDTQCGFKLFAGEVVRPIFERQQLGGFGFDVEVLAIARHLGYRIVEVPVRWVNDEDSRVTLLQGAAAFLDPLRVRLGILLGRYRRAGAGTTVEEKRAARPFKNVS